MGGGRHPSIQPVQGRQADQDPRGERPAQQGLASAIPGLEWLQKVLPSHHDHAFKDSASNRSMIHTEPVICLNEMDLNNMIDILSRLQDR